MKKKAKKVARVAGKKVTPRPRATASTACRVCEALELRLNTLIVWMAQSANSPITQAEAERLLTRIGRP